jgi:hypothetical protein
VSANQVAAAFLRAAIETVWDVSGIFVSVFYSFVICVEFVVDKGLNGTVVLAVNRV